MPGITEKTHSISTLYLVFFNVFLTIGWFILFTQFLSHIIYQDMIQGLWDATRISLMVFQSLAVFEVFHAIIGIVRSNPLLTLCQVFSRVFVLWAILYAIPVSRTSLGFPLLLLAWCITEIIRYSFYFCSLLGVVPYFLVYLRYTLFIALYPIGVTGEMLCMYSALSVVQQQRYFSVTLPNPINFAFDSYYGLLVIMALYIPVFPQLYFHMFAQRKKVLQPETKKRD